MVAAVGVEVEDAQQMPARPERGGHGGHVVVAAVHVDRAEAGVFPDPVVGPEVGVIEGEEISGEVGLLAHLRELRRQSDRRGG
jgi:hypothetical protein